MHNVTSSYFFLLSYAQQMTVGFLWIFVLVPATAPWLTLTEEGYSITKMAVLLVLWGFLGLVALD